MEEDKKAKVVDLRPKSEERSEERSQKMSYEQLENIAHQLSEQVRQLYAKLQEANTSNLFRRLDYLFKVVENAHMFNKDFEAKCLKEIEELMTIPEPEEDSDK